MFYGLRRIEKVSRKGGGVATSIKALRFCLNHVSISQRRKRHCRPALKAGISDNSAHKHTVRVVTPSKSATSCVVKKIRSTLILFQNRRDLVRHGAGKRHSPVDQPKHNSLAITLMTHPRHRFANTT